MKHNITIKTVSGNFVISWVTMAGTVVLSFASWEAVHRFITALDAAQELETDSFADR